MKKITLFVALFVLWQGAFAGGLLTNANQSAQYIRMLSRNASTNIDAVYFNPAGLIKLEDGWHFAVYSQTIFQDKTVDSKFPFLNDGNYLGEVQVPVFPTAFAVYKMEDWAFSLGFGPNAGGGSAEFDRGLPSFEIPITKVVPGLAGLTQINPAWSVSGYDANLSFNGSSVFWGIQLGATYRLSDAFSVYGGMRYLPSRNSYEGSIQNIQLQVNDELVNASSWLTQTSQSVSGLATQASTASAQLGGTANNLQPLIDQGAGDLTLQKLESQGYIDAATKAQLEGGLQSIGLTEQQISSMNLNMVQSSYSGAAQQYGATANQLSGTANLLTATSAQLGDKEVKTEQTGAGFTPMIGINVSPNDNLNIAVKYEMKTSLSLENDTEVDDLGLFPDGQSVSNNIPAVLGVGIGYNNDLLEAQLSYNMYFDKGVEWGANTRYLVYEEAVKREIENNYYEIGLGLQFNVSDNFAVSVGGLRSKSGVADSWQSDFSFSNPSYTAGAGIMYKITDNLTLDAGVSNTFYEDWTVTFDDPDIGPYEEVFSKSTLNLAVGLSYSIF